MVQFHILGGLSLILIGILTIIFNGPVAKFFTMSAKITNVNPINPLVKIKNYDSKDKNTKKTMIIMGIFFIVFGLIVMIFPQYIINH